MSAVWRLGDDEGGGEGIAERDGIGAGHLELDGAGLFGGGGVDSGDELVGLVRVGGAGWRDSIGGINWVLNQGAVVRDGFQEIRSVGRPDGVAGVFDRDAGIERNVRRHARGKSRGENLSVIHGRIV